MKKIISFAFLLFICIAFLGCASSSKSTGVSEKKVSIEQQLEDAKKDAEQNEKILHELRIEEHNLDQEQSK
ncbi:MAG: hypothetical protein AB1633_08780 [Elusimicrobiota bacterium]